MQPSHDIFWRARIFYSAPIHVCFQAGEALRNKKLPAAMQAVFLLLIHQNLGKWRIRTQNQRLFISI